MADLIHCPGWWFFANDNSLPKACRQTPAQCSANMTVNAVNPDPPESALNLPKATPAGLRGNVSLKLTLFASLLVSMISLFKQVMRACVQRFCGRFGAPEPNLTEYPATAWHDGVIPSTTAHCARVASPCLSLAKLKILRGACSH